MMQKAAVYFFLHFQETIVNYMQDQEKLENMHNYNEPRLNKYLGVNGIWQIARLVLV